MFKKNKLLSEFFAPLIDARDEKLKQIRSGIVLEKDTKYFDWTGSGLAHTLIEKRVKKLLPYYSNTHSEVSTHSKLMNEVYLKSKDVLKKSLELNSDFVVLCTGFGATGAIKRFQEILGIYIPPKTKHVLGLDAEKITIPRVLIGPYEHHSNEISWREGLCKVERLALKEGVFDLKALKDALDLQKNIKIISFNLASNVTGILAPYREISSLARKNKILLAFDMASSSPHMNISSDLFDACFLSPHKLLGGVGSSGLLCLRKNLIDTSIPPSFSGGGVVKYVSRKTQEYFEDVDIREEAGTPGLLQLYRAALAYQLRNEYGLEDIIRRENILTQMLLHELRNIPAVKIYGNGDASKIGIISLNVGGISPYDLAFVLSSVYGIQTRAGCSCAGPYGHDLLDMEDGSFDTLKIKPGWLRISIHYTHSLEDLEYLVDSLKKAIKTLRGG
ncbi:aminotransferase class V-fold PLP-dependent enzyme [Helicobacter cappadocius]|uniref:Aminotransferase class V-fold PLP-dependent enzyme n=1 Tax=Helicobacter cappadocius TaxID=3063998 RepID=A0AA90T970_9HELI|nr:MULTISPECIES: aminotransferase class V-fold PLP-dependent enzyme [unclassified Helicobacter]MDO7252685.1 aminotransferase class V-fold PLP-dependent enzyme [Helicobacter sp. faydin-H75]MDP2538552.1 aminotransferase class V-fold PLP-dependent enzyme [Helicobacter sp. faydin-H76]